MGSAVLTPVPAQALGLRGPDAAVRRTGGRLSSSMGVRGAGSALGRRRNGLRRGGPARRRRLYGAVLPPRAGSAAGPTAVGERRTTGFARWAGTGVQRAASAARCCPAGSAAVWCGSGRPCRSAGHRPARAVCPASWSGAGISAAASGRPALCSERAQHARSAPRQIRARSDRNFTSVLAGWTFTSTALQRAESDAARRRGSALP